MAPIEEIFCEADDFCKVFFSSLTTRCLPLPAGYRERQLSMYPSEIMTIIILFHLRV
jgi:hypothetical protein